STCRFWGFDWDYVMAHLPYDWDVVQLAIICRPDYLITRIHPRRPHDWSAACYLLSRHHARKLMALHERGGTYKIDNGVMPKPVAEQVIFESGRTYSMPLFLYRPEFQSAIHQEDVEDVHTQCRQAVLDWWSRRSAHVTPEALFRPDASPWSPDEK